MVGNRSVVFVLALCWVLAGCGGAPFTSDDAFDAVSAVDTGSPDPDGGVVDPSNEDAAPASPDAGSVTAGRDGGSTTGEDAGGHADGDAALPDTADAGACDGGPLYLHHVGLLGLTWRDCVPTGTYDATEALAACAVYAAATGAVADPRNDYGLCNLGGATLTGNAVLNASGTVLSDGGYSMDVNWTYDAVDFCPSRCATGHVAVADESLSAGSVTSTQDPEWD